MKNVYLEASWAPVNELDGTLGLDSSNSSVDILGHDITTVQHAASHVLAVTRIAFHHLVGRLEASVGNFANSQLLVVGLLSRDDRSVGNQREVDTWVRHQVGLELCKIDVESTIETERGSDGGNDLSDQTVQVGVSRALNVQVAAADVVDCFVVDHESAVGMFQSGMGSQDGIVRFDDGSGNLGSRVDGEFELGLLSVVDRQTLHQQGSEARASASTEGMENEETLKASALVRQLADAVEHQIDDFLANGVVTTGVVVGGVFLSGNQLLRVEKSSVSTSANFVNDSRLKIDKDSTRYVFARTFIMKLKH